jgi:hypothetical protein
MIPAPVLLAKIAFGIAMAAYVAAIRIAARDATR